MCYQSEVNSNTFPVLDLPPSNIGGEDITKTAFDFWANGQDREEIMLEDLEMSLSASAFNNNCE